jgi:hypothetical protein
MNWTKTEIQGVKVDALYNQGVLAGYLVFNSGRSTWMLHRGDHQMFFQVYTRDEGMRVLEEIARFGRWGA